MGPGDDPYFEQIPESDLHFYQRKGTKRKRRIPDSIGKHNLKILNSVRRKAYRLDLQLSICGARFGWAGIIGLIPWVGDVIVYGLAMQLLRKAEQIEGGLPVGLRRKMMANIIFDFLIGLIPIVGDLINILYKCNLRNFVLLEAYLVEKYLTQVSGTRWNTKPNPRDANKLNPVEANNSTPLKTNNSNSMYPDIGDGKTIV